MHATVTKSDIEAKELYFAGVGRVPTRFGSLAFGDLFTLSDKVWLSRGQLWLAGVVRMAWSSDCIAAVSH